MASDEIGKMGQRYWVCFIGPTDQDALPYGADSPMRQAVSKAFLKLTGRYEDTIASGWGVSEETMQAMMKEWK